MQLKRDTEVKKVRWLVSMSCGYARNVAVHTQVSPWVISPLGHCVVSLTTTQPPHHMTSPCGELLTLSIYEDAHPHQQPITLFNEVRYFSTLLSYYIYFIQCSL